MKYKYIFLVIIGLIIILLVYNITGYYYDYKENLELTKKIEKVKNNINFKELKKINIDTVGFIKIRNTNVNYPVVQSSDNDYYLDHSYTKEKSSAGAIFLDYRNDLNNLSKNNIIYGHHRLDNTMFGSLSDIFKEEWLSNKDNYYITIYTPNEQLDFKIFSIYTISKESYYIKTYFSNSKYFKEFLETIMKRSIFNFGTNVNTNDKILTLSTCKNNFGKRIVVHAKLLKKEETS